MSTGLETKWQNCVKDANGKVLIGNDQVKEECRKYMEKLLNENTWDNATTCENVEGPCELIRRDEISKALRMMGRKKDAIRYGIKPKQKVIGISIKRQDEMQGEVLRLYRKRQGKSLLI